MNETAVWVSRRSFVLGALATSGCAIVPFRGGSSSGGFGSRINLGPTADIDATLSGTPRMYVPEGRFYLVAVPHEWREPLKAATEESLHAGLDAGYTALFQTCPHLGCRVPECDPSGQFECPCHGSRYGPLGEKRGGPAPRGMDRMPTWVDNGELIVDSGRIVQGVPIGVDLGGSDERGCVEEVEPGD